MSYDFAVARRSMVEGQLRPNGVTDGRILDAMERIKRESFLPPTAQDFAYLDGDVQIGADRFMLSPMMLARMLQVAALKESDHALTIGAGTGYAAAVVAQIAARVTALESDHVLLGELRKATADFPSITVAEGDMPNGAAMHGPFDVILVEGCVGEMPHELLSQLTSQGRIIAPYGTAAAAEITTWSREGDSFSRRSSFAAQAHMLSAFAPARADFVFA